MLALTAGGTRAGVLVDPAGAIIFVSSESRAGSIVDLKTASAPGLADWSATVTSEAFNDQQGSYASGDFTLLTGFTPDNFHCGGNGVGTAVEGGTVRGGSLVGVFFVVERVQSYFANSYQINGTYASNRLLAFVANMNNGETQVIPLLLGEGYTSVSGRLPPGTYMLYMQNGFGPEGDAGDAITFSTAISFLDVTNPLIITQPTNRTVHVGGTAMFNVGTSGSVPSSASVASGAMTFQWRKGLQNLSDGGRISGVHTSQLVITNAAATDSGLYDCVVTQDAITEPSSLVHLTVNATTDVGPAARSSALRMAPPSPSPFWERTQILYTLPRESGATLDVLDVGGRLVRRLLPAGPIPAGDHVAVWDGRDERGSRTPAGVYFLRLASGMEQAVRRVVRLDGPR